MVVHIKNPHESRKIGDIVNEMVGQRSFIGWPFLQEGLVVAVSDALFKYEKISVVPGTAPKVVSNPHSPQGLNFWKMKAERIEQIYSKKCGVITGNVEVLLHVRPLKGLKRLGDGAFVKDYEGSEKETEQAIQMTLGHVTSEDPRYIERPAPPLSEEFPDGSKIFFLGEHAYGVVAHVSATTETSLSVKLGFFPSEKSENDKFKAIIQDRTSERYYPSFRAAEMVGISGRALSKISSSFMVITSDGVKNNLGLSLKFEGKSMKVIDYSRKEGRNWEFSEKAIKLLIDYKTKFPDIFRSLDEPGDAMAKASEVLSVPDSDGRVREIKIWLKTQGVRDFEPVSLFCDQLTKNMVNEIEKMAASFNANKSPTAMKKAFVNGIPRQAVLKPAHAVYRLQNQHFALGDRVTMIQDSGAVPLAAKGVVIGLNSKSMNVVWDVPFMSGTTLGDKCSQYRGLTVDFNSCLNLTNPQFVTPTNPKAPSAITTPLKPRFGPRPTIPPAQGQPSASAFRPAQPSQKPFSPVSIMSNPRRGRGGYVSRRGAVPTGAPRSPVPGVEPSKELSAPSTNGPALNSRPIRGFNPGRGRGGFVPGLRGRGAFISNMDRGRGNSPYRGRGRESFAAPLPS
ncbi:uncharacterized protein BT62DRAFT_883045 [Guyanagaster necrorhizus]|uniref:Uncharacterized protein n=1 Tax=Guyanagaster necrorhizus TaxID=856835 RepID=A0A9P7W537_9AGAR|nr:uncharacterized protein BT62DRAFT_883045 [Guyanagaster necrorhizus MCA 3950]KAG7451466.1 hypothetical protein BT62DRAFT_883045 [Guyanagaster necrorhizus MCA 3950]